MIVIGVAEERRGRGRGGGGGGRLGRQGGRRAGKMRGGETRWVLHSFRAVVPTAINQVTSTSFQALNGVRCCRDTRSRHFVADRAQCLGRSWIATKRGRL